MKTISPDQHLVIRADASSQIGTGHVMRCLALAQAWKDSGGEVSFVMASDEFGMKERFQLERIEVIQISVLPGSSEDAEETGNIALEKGCAWIILDGYHFSTDYLQTLKKRGLGLFLIDDNGYKDYSAVDIILNQNLHGHERLYTKRKPSTRLLLGSTFVLLRREFLKWRKWQREIPQKAQKVLVTLGGSDPDNMTLRVIQALNQFDDEKIEVVVVVANSLHRDKLQKSISERYPVIQLKDRIMDMAGLMAWGDVAISAGGSTCWELAFMGLPNIIIVLAENQQEVARQLESYRVSVNLGWHTEVNEEVLRSSLRQLLSDARRRQEMSERGRSLVDGYGALRVVSILKEGVI